MIIIIMNPDYHAYLRRLAYMDASSGYPIAGQPYSWGSGIVRQGGLVPFYGGGAMNPFYYGGARKKRVVRRKAIPCIRLKKKCRTGIRSTKTGKCIKRKNLKPGIGTYNRVLAKVKCQYPKKSLKAQRKIASTHYNKLMGKGRSYG